MSCGDIFLALIAILFPPIAVWIKSGLCSADSLINILLCVLGYLPGLLHAWYIIAHHPERDYDYEPVGDAEQQRVTHYHINRPPSAGGRQNYGTNQAPKPQQQIGVTGNNTENRATSSEQSGQQNQPSGPSQGAGSKKSGAPPSYSDVVKGDNKIQSQE